MLIVLLVASLASSLPLRLLAFNPRQLSSQQPFVPAIETPQAHISDQNLERRPRSVEMVLTSDNDEEMIRVWLPLGKRIYPRKFLER